MSYRKTAPEQPQRTLPHPISGHGAWNGGHWCRQQPLRLGSLLVRRLWGPWSGVREDLR